MLQVILILGIGAMVMVIIALKMILESKKEQRKEKNEKG